MHAPRARRRAASSVRHAPSLHAHVRLRGWSLLVSVSVAICILVALLAIVGWIASLHTNVTTYSYSGAITHVRLRLASGDATIVSSPSAAVEVRRTDRYAFGHAARERRSFAAGIVSVSSSCPRIILGSCSASYEVAVPETATVEVRTGDGNVRLDGFRGSANVRTGSGSVAAAAYCGFDLSAVSGSGDLQVATACAPRHLLLHTGSGNASALVPPGRYRVDASGARRRVGGVTPDAGAPFTLDLHSGSGTVTIGGGL
ncbi:MAG: hypothetical protein JWM60_1962 [Solirubrobacterales bacterium]|nr:hypothetical protein [Solirubrobacterales bacterium]